MKKILKCFSNGSNAQGTLPKEWVNSYYTIRETENPNEIVLSRVVFLEGGNDGKNARH